METCKRNIVWLRLAGALGIVVAIALTAVVWLYVIDQQAMAMFRGDNPVVGTPFVIEYEADRYANDTGVPLRPMP